MRRGILSVATLSAGPTMTGPRSRTQQDGRVLPRAELQGRTPGLLVVRHVVRSQCKIVCRACANRTVSNAGTAGYLRVVRIFNPSLAALRPGYCQLCDRPAPTRAAGSPSPWARRVALRYRTRRDPARASGSAREPPTPARSETACPCDATTPLDTGGPHSLLGPDRPASPDRLALRLGTAPALPVRA